MILQAFCENRMQYFYANEKDIYKKKKYISTVIKNPIVIYEKTDDKTGELSYYRYDRTGNIYIPFVSKADMKDWVTKFVNY
jgi:uncharacterized protein YecE (DUF72 family)